MWIVLVLVLAVVAGISLAVYQQEQAESLVQQGISFFETKSNCNKVGDCIDLFIPAEPDVQRPVTDSSEVRQQPQNQTFYDENGELVTNQSYITGAVADTSFTRTGAKESKYREIEDRMIVTKGNIATIEGQIKLRDENGEIVEPRIYKYFLTIECSELTEFCNLNPISSRGTTNNGSFIYKWTTSFRDTEGLYVVSIYAESEQKDIYGFPYRVENQLFVELV